MSGRYSLAQTPAFAQPIEVADGVLWARLPLPYQLDHVNVYFIDEGDGWAIIDSGIYDTACVAAWNQMLAGPMKGFRFTRLIVTHYHPDHMGLAKWLCERFDIPLHMSRSEYLMGQYLSHSPNAVNGAFHRDHFARHGMSAVQLTSVLDHGYSYLKLISGLPDIYHPLYDGQELQLGGRCVKILTGGGHSPEQVMLHLPDEAVFFAADQVIEKISPNVSVHAAEPDDNPLGAFLASLTRLIAEIPAKSKIFSGHRLPMEDLPKRAADLITHHEERCAFLVDLLAKTPMHLTAMTPKLFTRPLDAHQFGFAFAETLAHVNLLVARGLVKSEMDKGIVIYHA